MPVRNRSGSSPIRGSGTNEGVNALIPSFRRSSEGRLRRGSLGAVEIVKQRARRDTTTSSEMSSENEIEPSIYKRRHVNPKKAAKANSLLTEKHMEDELLSSRVAGTINEDSAEDSDRTSLSSEFAGTVEAGSLLDDVPNPLNGSPLTQLQPLQTPLSLSPNSLRKPRHQSSSILPALPPPRPISMIQPVSLLGEAIRAGRSKPKNPIEIFARLSGKGSLDPLNIRIYAPFSETPIKPIDMPLLRHAPDAGAGEKGQVSVAEAIGLSLWRYHEESFKRPIEGLKLNVNRWTFRMVEDGEVDYEFPALSRTRPMVDFTYHNNNRTARARAREKPYDEFALVEATEAQFRENQALTPKYEQLANSAVKATNEIAVLKVETDKRGLLGPQAKGLYSKPITGPADKIIAATNSTPRMGPSKTLKIHFTSLEAFTQITTIEVTTDTYLAEVLDIACKRFKIDKAYHILKVTGTNTVAPVDRYVEALGTRPDLDLVRRRFVNEGTLGLAGSPGSSSPNAPLLLTSGTPKKGKGSSRNPFTAAQLQLQPLAQRHQDLLLGSTTKYKKYNVVRKQPMSFAPSQQRVILMDEDYMHILPSESGKTLFDTSAKTNRIPFSMIVGCKVSRRHPKTFRVSSSLPPIFYPSLFLLSTLAQLPADIGA